MLISFFFRIVQFECVDSGTSPVRRKYIQTCCFTAVSNKHLNIPEKVRLIRFQLFKTDIKDNCQLTNEQQARKLNKLYYLLLCLILLIFCHIAWPSAEYKNVPNAEMSNINDSAHSWSDHKNSCNLYSNALVNVIKINVHCVRKTHEKLKFLCDSIVSFFSLKFLVQNEIV